jgi:small subunit ribosomal protein S18
MNNRENKYKVKKRRKRVCFFCSKKINDLSYKDVNTLRKYISDRGKILPRRASGCCSKHQRLVNDAIGKARSIGLIPYIIK